MLISGHPQNLIRINYGKGISEVKIVVSADLKVVIMQMVTQFDALKIITEKEPLFDCLNTF